MLEVFFEFLEVELGGHDCVFQHFDVLGIRVQTAQFLKIVVELYFLEDFADEVDSADEAFHFGFESDVGVGAALSGVVLE